MYQSGYIRPHFKDGVTAFHIWNRFYGWRQAGTAKPALHGDFHTEPVLFMIQRIL
ncbi:hypothetical protein RUMCAL_02991 [Ruminococcus callidus ATCC 27760]|uniref:Uncharacterized protein n=1 Tax=Ruminococcus callidus ATCC 27760 TaxID=411473 RepID=U2JSI7_9FIRM|nr:hypothetical protein RUMCAL_02991 [Ruminococcus callidus ATCC 27760]